MNCKVLERKAVLMALHILENAHTTRFYMLMGVYKPGGRNKFGNARDGRLAIRRPWKRILTSPGETLWRIGPSRSERS